MNYRHIFHAGSFADVFKHLFLISLVQSLQLKSTPFCYLDTHAGIGVYDLKSIAAQKTHEYFNGIAKLWPMASQPALVKHYLKLIKDCNAQLGCSELRYYPGSPCLVKKILRSNDRMILSELHPQDVLTLKQIFRQDPQVAVHHLDAYQALKAFLPPKQARGLVLIDPPFEKEDEFSKLSQQLQWVVNHWPQGIYAVWYPIKQHKIVQKFYQELKSIKIREIVACEFHISNTSELGLTACGMLIINPPWQWLQEIEKLLPWLCTKLGPAKYHIKWLNLETAVTPRR